MPLPCSLCLPATTIPASLPTTPNEWETIPIYLSENSTGDTIWYVSEEREDAPPQVIPGIPHHQTIEALRNSARSCPLCELILQDVNSLATSFKKIRDEGTKYLLSLGLSYPSEFKLRLLKRMDDGAGFVVCVEDGKHDDLLYFASIIGFCRKAGGPKLQGIPGIEIIRDAGSDIPLEVARQWMKDCRENHTFCHASKGFLPIRVLDLEAFSDIGRIRLEDTRTRDEIHGEYAALSHCWGQDQTYLVKTTRDNLEEQLLNIDVEGLPQTFRDAIKVTRRLGIRYLWIDSLCICQDDEKEWARESFAMAEIYSRAHLTIAADGSKGPINGLFQRKERSYVPVTLTIASSEATTDALAEKTAPALAFRAPIASITEIQTWYGLGDQPLSKRAWAFQEQRLPHRVLHFTDKQLLYECNTHLVSEDGFYGSGRWNSLYPGPDPAYTFFKKDSRGSASRQAWSRLLEPYTKRKLTFNSDRFPAISGLARSIHERLRSQGNSDVIYLAGLWSDFLVEGLAWSGSMIDHCLTPPDRPLPGQSNYIAPSWSWASFPGQCTTHLLQEGHQNIAIMTGYNVVLKDKENPYGEVVEGWIKLRGPLFKIQRSEIVPKRPMHVTGNIRFYVPGTNEGGFSVDLDGVLGESQELDEWVHGRDFYILILSKALLPPGFYTDERAAYTCMLLEAHTPDQMEMHTCARQFRKVGTAMFPITLLSEKYGNLESSNEFTEILVL